MSAPEYRVLYTPDAVTDIQEILLYGVLTLGPEQASAYQVRLKHSIAELAENPHIGRRRDAEYPGARARLVGSHIVYYRIVDRTIEVLRIHHQHADPRRSPER